MRSFVAIIAVAAVIGVIGGQQAGHAVAASRVSNSQNALDRISDIAAAPLKNVLPEAHQPPKPPINLSGAQFTKTLTAPHVIVEDAASDAIIFSKNADQPQALASVTKLMTALLLTEKITNWNATTTISNSAVVDSSKDLVAGETYTLHDLFAAGLVGSLNTAMNALVQASGFTPEQFAVLMNQRAADLGMPTMHFEDVTGLSAHNVGSAKDVSRLIKIALSSAQIKVTSVEEKVSIHELESGKKKTVKATDWVLTGAVPLKAATIEGGKTGYTDEAGYNFASLIRSDDGHEIRVVVMGAGDVYKRFTETAMLAEWTFDNFTWPTN